MPRGRADPFRQVAKGSALHLEVPSDVLEKDRPKLDQPEGSLASGDDGVHTGTIRVVGADATVAVAVQGGGVTAVAAVTFARDEIDERGALGLLHHSLAAAWTDIGARVTGDWGAPSTDLAQV